VFGVKGSWVEEPAPISEGSQGGYYRYWLGMLYGVFKDVSSVLLGLNETTIPTTGTSK